MPDAEEMVELMYEFEQPLVLDGSKFANASPDFRYTPMGRRFGTPSSGSGADHKGKWSV